MIVYIVFCIYFGFLPCCGLLSAVWPNDQIALTSSAGAQKSTTWLNFGVFLTYIFVFARSPIQQPTFCFFGVFVFVCFLSDDN
jgi:hypothetical protein